MLKYYSYAVTFAEVPDEISLYITISNCPIKCKDCNSKWLWKDEGIPLTIDKLSDIVNKSNGITCICFGGGEHNLSELGDLFKWVKENTELKVCWYTGLSDIPSANSLRITQYCDYIKYGPYREECGPITSKTTNQRFVQRVNGVWKDITNKFWR